MWVEVDLILSLSFLLLQVIQIFITKCNPLASGTYAILVLLLNIIAFIVWVIYGSIIFFHKNNDCEAIPATQGMDRLMLGLLVVGYIKTMLFLYYNNL